METQELTLPGQIVKMSNTLARAPWCPQSVWEARLLATVASIVKKDDDDFQDYTIPLDALLDGSSDGDTYAAIDAATDRLQEARVNLPKENGRGFKKYSFFSYFEYDAPGKGIPGKLTCRFDKAMKPHFLALKSHFKKWDRVEFLSLPSVYSQRLFMILKSWDDKPEITISISELHKMLDAPKSIRSNFKDFRRRVLEPAHKHITSKTSLSFDWEPIKEGRKVHSVRFVFSKPRQMQVVKTKEKQTSQKNNELFKMSAECLFKAHGGRCDKGNPKTPKLCAFCQKNMQ